MNSLTAFAKRCAGLIEQHTPFLAYCHAQGCAVLILDGGERTEYTVKYKCRNEGSYRYHTLSETTDDPKRVAVLLDRPAGEIIKTKVVHKTPLAATVTGFRKAIEKMKKDPRIRWSLCVVESDGHGYNIEGDNLGALLREMGMTEQEAAT